MIRLEDAKPGVDVRPSAEIRAQLAKEGRPVLLAFSGGKDAILAWLALRESGVQVIPYHMYIVPDMPFIEKEMADFEAFFGQKIHRYPHPGMLRMLDRYVFQPPAHLAVIDAAQLPTPNYAEFGKLIRADLGLPEDTWVADGVRAADSIIRRVSMKRFGAMKPKDHKVSAVWDWQIGELRDKLAAEGVKLPIDYEWFGRSFDGLDYRFLEPIYRNSPEDWAAVLKWWPLAELEILRHAL